MRDKKTLSLIPNPNETFEQRERFNHDDLARLDVARAWGERRLLDFRLAELCFAEDEGSTIYYGPSTDDRCTTAQWIRVRIQKLDQHLRRLKAAA